MYTKQRTASPKFGLHENILLPWYEQFTRQYRAAPYGEWAGNASLLRHYEQIALDAGDIRFSHRRLPHKHVHKNTP